MGSYSDMQVQSLIERVELLKAQRERMEHDQANRSVQIMTLTEDNRRLKAAHETLIVLLGDEHSHVCECERWRDGITVCPVHLTEKV